MLKFLFSYRPVTKLNWILCLQSLLGPFFLGDPCFQIAFSLPLAFSWWQSNKLITLTLVQDGSMFVPFDHLHSQRNISPQEFFHYLQIRHFFTTHYWFYPSSPNTYYKTILRGKDFISNLYSSYIRTIFWDSNQHMSRWEKGCDILFSLEDLNRMISNMHSCTKSLAIRETALMLLTRWYYTPCRLHILCPDVFNFCFRYCPSRGILMHIFWSHDKVQTV